MNPGSKPRAQLSKTAFAVWFFVAFTGTSCRPERPADELVAVVDSPVRSLDPRLAVDNASARLSRLIFEGLTEIDEAGLPRLVLAERIDPGPERDASGRPLSYRAVMRKDATFHDGTPLTGADVAYTYQSVMDPTFGTVISGAFRRRFKAVVVDPDDPHVVHFILRRPLATFLTDIVLGIAPKRLARAPKQRFSGLPIGSGPWRLVAPFRKDRVVIARYEKHRGYKPLAPGQPRSLVFRAIADEGARALSVLGGGGDVAMGGLSPAVLDASTVGGRASIARANGIAWAYMGLNLRHDKLHDVRVRRAIAMAIDRRHIVATLFGGRARVSEGMMAPEHWAFAKLPATPHDIDRANALLDEAGLARGPDGVRLRLDLKVSTNRLRRAVGRAVARALGKVGIDVVVRSFELGTFLADVRAGRFDAFLLLLPEPLEPDFLAWMFHSQNAPIKTVDPAAKSPFARIERRAMPPGVFDASVTGDPDCSAWSRDAVLAAMRAFALAPIGLAERHGSANRTSYHHPVVDCLLERGRSVLARKERHRLYARAQRLIAADVPVVPLWFEDQTALVRAGVELPKMVMDGRYHVLGEARLPPP